MIQIDMERETTLGQRRVSDYDEAKRTIDDRDAKGVEALRPR